MTRYVALISVAVLALSSGVPDADAATPSRWVLTFDGTEPTFDSPYCGDANGYQVVTVTPPSSGEYHYVDLSISYDIDMQIDVYENSFDPLNPATNYVDGLDDRGPLTLTSGTTYFIVVSGLCDGSVVGTADFAITGPADLLGTDSVEDFEGIFTGTEPTFTSPRCSAEINSYVVVGAYSPPASGIYAYGDVSYGYDVDMQIDVYMGAFDPGNPGAGWVGGIDDEGTIDLNAGFSYDIVVSEYCGIGTPVGTWEFVLGLVEEQVRPIPVLSKWGLVVLVGLLAGVGYLLARRVV
jgi:hypothetical protein